MSEGTTTSGVGFTVIVYVRGVPVHPFAAGVTEIVAVTAAVPVFTAVKEGIVAVDPLAASPMEGLELVHANVVPVVVLVHVAAGTVAPLHTVLLAGTVTFGVGFTVMVYVAGEPVHPASVGVTIIVAVTGAVPVLVAVKAGVLLVPLAASPMDAAELVHA